MGHLRRRVSNEEFCQIASERNAASLASVEAEARLVETVIDVWDKGNRLPGPIVAALREYRQANARAVQLRHSFREQETLRREEG